MATQETISQDLYDFLVTKNFDPEPVDAKGDPSNARDAKVFSFDYTSATGKNYGTGVIVIADPNDLKFFYGDNLGRSMEEPDKTEWFKFLEELSDFATQHRHDWTPSDISKLKYTMAGIAAIKEGLFEGYYGTRKVSYVGEQTDARLVIKHNRMLGENDKRYRYVESLFIETADGERFKLPFKNVAGGRAMLEHVRQGGKPYDIRGNHIAQLVTEAATLSRFSRASQHKILEGATKELVSEAVKYYQQVRETIRHLSTGRGYSKYFESWTPAEIMPQEGLVEDIKTLFIEQTIDTRIEQALPILARLQQQGNDMKEAQIFESWINNLVEGTWSLPDTPEQQAKLRELMSQPLAAGPNGSYATEELYDIIGDDELFDIITDVGDKNPDADIWEDEGVQRRLSELGVYVVDKEEPAAPTAPETGAVTEGRIIDESGETLQHILDRFKHEVKQFENGGDLDQDLYEALFDYYFNAGEMPYGTAKARTGDPYEWVTQRLDQELGGMGFREMDEADNIASFVENGTCNGTMEGEYCPEHGLVECGTVAGGLAPVMGEADDPMNYNAAITSSYYEDIERLKTLARIK